MTNGQRELKGRSKKVKHILLNRKTISSNKNKIENLQRVSGFDSTIFTRFRLGVNLAPAVVISTASVIFITSSIHHRGPVTSGQLDVHLIYIYTPFTYTAHHVVNIIILTDSRRQGRRRQRLGVRYPRAGAK